jgi:cysteine desulfurase / selenocysteine lyase
MSDFNVEEVRMQFPLLNKILESKSKPIVYLDSAATSQKPQSVIDAISNYYETQNSNVHRSAHYLAAIATEKFEDARVKAQKFLNAKKSQEIIFTKGVTEAINLVANSFSKAHLKAGDEVLITQMEHHANIVPWQMLQEQMGIVLKYIPFNKQGELDLDLDKYFTDKIKLFCVTAMSNALGTINPIKKLIEYAHDRDVPVLVDGAQSAVHGPVDVQALDCDFFVCSSHKMYGPTGVGVLYGKEKWLDKMPPYQTGGEMIEHVSFAKTTFADLPHKFEAGTPNIAGVIGFGAALDFMNSIDWNKARSYEDSLLKYGTLKLSEFENLKIIGTAANKGPLISFVFDDIHANDIGSIVDECGVAVRVGHHCAMPAMEAFGVGSTVRASFSMYNTKEDIDFLVAALHEVRKIFA